MPLAAERPREELVPGAEPGQRPVGPDGDARLGVGAVRPRVVPGHQRREHGIERGGRGFLVARPHALAPFGEHGPGRGGRGGGGLLDQPGANLELGADVLACLHPPRELVAPRGEAVDPGSHREGVAAEALDRERPGEAVVPERQHPRLAEPARAVAAVSHDRGDDIVSVGEHIGGHLDDVAGDPLDGKPATVHPGPEVLDHDPPSTVDVRNHAARGLAGGPRHGGRTLVDRWAWWGGGAGGGPGLLTAEPRAAPPPEASVSRGGGAPPRR